MTAPMDWKGAGVPAEQGLQHLILGGIIIILLGNILATLLVILQRTVSAAYDRGSCVVVGWEARLPPNLRIFARCVLRSYWQIEFYVGIVTTYVTGDLVWAPYLILVEILLAFLAAVLFFRLSEHEAAFLSKRKYALPRPKDPFEEIHDLDEYVKYMVEANEAACDDKINLEAKFAKEILALKADKTTLESNLGKAQNDLTSASKLAKQSTVELLKAQEDRNQAVKEAKEAKQKLEGYEWTNFDLDRLNKRLENETKHHNLTKTSLLAAETARDEAIADAEAAKAVKDDGENGENGHSENHDGKDDEKGDEDSRDDKKDDKVDVDDDGDDSSSNEGDADKGKGVRTTKGNREAAKRRNIRWALASRENEDKVLAADTNGHAQKEGEDGEGTAGRSQEG